MEEDRTGETEPVFFVWKNENGAKILYAANKCTRNNDSL